ncbi:hypothetical protein GCM10027062_11830 [Nocardioides hungaricus]
MSEVERLEADLPGRRRGRWRPAVVTLLVVVIAVLTPLGVLARWMHDEVADTERYVESVAPLASDPAIQAAVTDRITAEITSRLRIQAVTEDAVDALADRGLPPLAASSLSALSGPLADSVEGFVRDQVAEMVASDRFRTAWEEANRQAHTQLVAVLTGEDTDLVQVGDDAVSVDLAPVVDAVKQRLIDRGFTLAERLRAVEARFTIFRSEDITQAQSAFRLLSTLNTVLPVLVLVLLALAVAIARRRRRAVIAAMLAIAASMLLLGVALNAFRAVYLDALPSDLPVDAAAAVYDTLVRFIRVGLRAVLALALAVAFVAWVSGPGTAPVALRRGTGGAVGWVRSGGERAGLDTGRFGELLGTYRAAIRGAVLGLALLLYAMADHPSAGFTVTLLGVAAVLLLIVELLSRTAPAPPSS